MALSEKWVGRSLERFEDEALLSGHARFIDDLEPVAGFAMRPSCAARTAAPILFNSTSRRPRRCPASSAY